MEVIRRKNNLYPCIQCRFKNNLRFPKTSIHAIQQRWIAYTPALLQGTYPEYAEIIGECNDFKSTT